MNALTKIYISHTNLKILQVCRLVRKSVKNLNYVLPHHNNNGSFASAMHHANTVLFTGAVKGLVYCGNFGK